MTKLSFSMISELYNCRMTWLNRLMGLEKTSPGFFKEGRDSHRIVQDHVSGKVKDPRFFKDNGDDMLPYFPIVEEEDFDPRLKFESPLFWRKDKEYYMIGYMDGKNIEEGNMLECKFSSKPWTPGKFLRSPQWKIYALFNDWIRNVYLVTATRDIDPQSLRIIMKEVENSDKEEAKAYIDGAISIIESGNFDPPDGEPCRSCFYINCPCPGCVNIRQYGS